MIDRHLEESSEDLKLKAKHEQKNERKRRNTIACKRRKNLMAKAKQLNMLSDLEVLLVIGSASGNIYQYASSGFTDFTSSELFVSLCTQVICKKKQL
ncbi:MAG: hypothetical protein MHMPM18_002301 [Marteilia pararefringens]